LDGCLRYNSFKFLVTASYDLPFNHLPANAQFFKKSVQPFGKICFLVATSKVLIRSFGYIVESETLAIKKKRDKFIYYIRKH